VGRIGVRGLPQLPYAGTGFMVAEDVVMTNCHVAMVFSQSGQDGEWSFQAGLEASLDFFEDPDARRTDGAPPDAIRIDDVIDPPGARPRSAAGHAAAGKRRCGRAAHRHVPGSGTARRPQPVRARLSGTGLPQQHGGSAFDLRRPVLRQAPAAGSGDGVSERRDDPHGALLDGAEPHDVIFHDPSTLGGNSGLCVVDLDSNQVIGLHFAGRYMQYNEAVALWWLVDDPLLSRAGVKFG
jgi:hypothetical protein